MEFKDFMDLPPLTDGIIELVCTAKNAAEPKKGWVPAYAFDICVDGERVGFVNLRVGFTDALYYSGQIGYIVDEAHRGNGYALRACRLLVPVLNFHKMQKVLICTEVSNIASNRICEKLGAKLIDTCPVPDWHDTYEQEGWRTANIYEWGW